MRRAFNSHFLRFPVPAGAGNSQSTGTVCTTCPAGKAANPTRTLCNDLLDSTGGGLQDAGVVASILSTSDVLPRVALDIVVDDAVLDDGSTEQLAFFAVWAARGG